MKCHFFILITVAFLSLNQSTLIQTAQAGNDFEVLVNEKMAKIKKKHDKIPEKKEKLAKKIDENQDEISKLPQIECAPGVFVPSFNASEPENIFKYQRLVSEIDSFSKKMDSLEWQLMKKKVVPLTKDYSWAIPNDKAIATIKKYGPIVEIGAGTGYWAKLLADEGVDVVAYDNEEANKYSESQYNKTWVQVNKGDESAVLQHPDRTLMLCWPPRWNEMASNSLNSYQGKYVVYVGEIGPTAATGTQKFFSDLETHFELIETADIQNWPGYSDKVYIYRRK
jgi:hypothetical protein